MKKLVLGIGMYSNGSISENRITYCSIGVSCIEENSESGNVKIENNRIGYCDYGIKQRLIGYSTQMTTIQYNWVYECCEVGIEIEEPVLLESNAVWDSEVGIEDKHSSGTVNLYENTVWRCGSYGFYLHASSTTNMYNNISMANNYGIKGSLSYANCDYNCVYISTTDNYDPDGFQGANDINADPQFRSPPFS